MHSTNKPMDDRRRVSRRDFLKLLGTGAANLALLALLGGGYSYWIEPGRVIVERVGLKLRRLSPAFSGIRLAQVSDIHMGGWMTAERLQKVADKVAEEKPEFLLLTGDYLLGHEYDTAARQSLSDLVEILAPLAASIPTCGVLGNHDYWTNANAVRSMLKTCGITDLTNNAKTILRGGEKLHLCGIDDLWEGDVRLDAVLEQLPEDGAAILLAHEPDFADTSAATGRFDLQLSGHSHGGQIVLPFVGPPVLPYLGQKYPLGLYRVGEMLQYTNRGVGMARLPIRINCPPEITLFTLTAGGS